MSAQRVCMCVCACLQGVFLGQSVCVCVCVCVKVFVYFRVCMQEGVSVSMSVGVCLCVFEWCVQCVSTFGHCNATAELSARQTNHTERTRPTKQQPQFLFPCTDARPPHFKRHKI